MTKSQPANGEAARQRYLVILIIGLAQVAAVFLYGIVIHYAVNRGVDRLAVASAKDNNLKPVFVVLSAVAILIIPAVRSFFRSAASDRMFTGRAVYERGMITAMAVFALCEVPAILGFLAAILSGNPGENMVFAAISLCGFAYYFPRPGAWQEWIGQWQAAASQKAQFPEK